MNKLLEIAHQEKLDLLAKIKSILPVEIERKINLYLSHPISDFLKPHMKDYEDFLEEEDDYLTYLNIKTFFGYCKCFREEYFRRSTAIYCVRCGAMKWKKCDYDYKKSVGEYDVYCIDCLTNYCEWSEEYFYEHNFR